MCSRVFDVSGASESTYVHSSLNIVRNCIFYSEIWFLTVFEATVYFVSQIENMDGLCSAVGGVSYSTARGPRFDTWFSHLHSFPLPPIQEGQLSVTG